MSLTLLTTMVGADSQPVVQAAKLMKTGKHSKNPRLQQLLTSINRRNIRFFHNSAKKGFHTAPDTLSRMNRSCNAKDCAVERFLADIPTHVQCMTMSAEGVPTNMTDLVFAKMDQCVLAATSTEMARALLPGPGYIPLGSKKTWRDIQHTDRNCRIVLQLKSTGNLPTKKTTNPTINKYFKESVVEDGLLVVRMFDKHLMREVSIDDNPQGEEWRQHRNIKKNDTVRVFDTTSDSWRTVTVTSHQIKFYKKNGPYHNVRFEDGSEAGFYFRPGESWSIVENEEIQQQIQQVDGAVTPDSLSPDIFPLKTNDVDPEAETPATLPHETLEEVTPRQIRQQTREMKRNRVKNSCRVYNLRSTAANPIDETEYLDENYSDMDSVFGETQEQFNDQCVMSRMSAGHINLGIPTDMQLVRDR